jgi:hypothetical protein
MRSAARCYLTAVTMALGMFASSASGSVITYVTPTDAPNGSSSIAVGGAYTANLGYAFKTGASGPYDIDWVTLELQPSSTGSRSFTIAIHGTDNQTAYSAVASSTAYATDTVTFSAAAVGPLTLNLTSADLPNITGYQLLSNMAYALIVYNASSGLALRRTQGYADQTTNTYYTVTNGFTMLDTFRNNTPNYANTANSYVTFHMSFGQTAAAAVSEPASIALLLPVLVGGLALRRRNRISRGSGHPLPKHNRPAQAATA